MSINKQHLNNKLDISAKRFFKIHSTLFFVLIALLISIPSYAQKKGKKDKKKKNKKVEAISDIKAEGLLIDAKTKMLLGNTKEAEELLIECIKLDPANDAAFYELSRVALERNNLKDAVDYAKAATNLDANNKYYELQYAENLAQNRQYDAAAEIYKKLISKHPNNPDYYLEHAQLLNFSGNLKEAIKVLDIFESKVGIDETISMEKQRMYIQLNDVEGAAKEIEKLAEAFPNEPRYKHMIAEIFNANGESEKAQAIYKELAETNPNDPYARLAMADFYRQNGNKEKGLAELKAAFGSKELSANPKVKLLIANLGVPDFESEDANGKLKETLELAEILVETHPENARANAIYGDLLLQNKEIEKSITYLKKAVGIDGSMLEIWQQLFFAQEQLRQYPALAEDSKKAMELFPNQSMVYFFNGYANNQLKKYDKALKSLKQAVLIGSDNNSVMADTYAMIGDIYNTQETFDKSDEAFDKAIEFDPNNAGTLNNYSYYLSVRDENLDKAAEMSKRSNELTPNVSSFEDTYGWILYRQQNFEDAKEWIEKAIKNGGNERAVIVDHYGDVLYRLKMVDAAVEQWKKAKTLGLDSDVIDRKIADRKVYE